jgi:MFS family permease
MSSLSKQINSKDANNFVFDSKFFLIISISMIAISGVLSINPVVPKIAQSLNVAPQNIGMIMTIFLIPTTFGSLIFGALADRFGRKKILIPSLLLFGIGGILCASATNFTSLLEWRFLTGIGAASLEAIELTLISDLYSGKMLTSAMGMNAAMIGLAATIYPLVGGMLAEFSWRYVFLLSMLAFPIALIISTKLKLPTKQSSTQELNLKSYLNTTWKNIQNPKVIGLLFTVFSMFIIELGAFYIYLPMYAGTTLHASGAEIGIILSIESIAFAIAASQLGILTRLFSERSLISSGFLICGLSLLVMPSIHSTWSLVTPCIIFGISQAFALPSLQSMLAEIAPEGHRASFMALNVTVQSLGRALGPLFAGLSFGVWGIQGVFYANALLAIITVIIFNFLFNYKTHSPRN